MTEMMTMNLLKLDAEAAQNIADTFAGCRALILEDEIGPEMKAALEAAGCESVDLFETGDAALEALEVNAYDVLVLDRINPGIEGLEVLDRVRRRPNGLKTDPDVPALVYSLLGGEDQRIHGLIARGADDYVPKPATSEELVARVAAQLRRRKPTMRSKGWTCAPLEVDADTKDVRCNGRLLQLTSREADILVELYKERGNPLSQSMLWDRCWIGKGWSHFPEEFANTVDQAIKRLRKSLKRQCPDIPDDFHPLVTNIWAQGFALRNLAGMEGSR
ncbi:response regulator transcription factor [Sphingomonas sp.]|uniref:response regulator transcription factor n=1 Tax=Sphingomonas sp. TaxID=28214 RepID=UPI0017DBC9BE|nr:response regulator transcription factor [Sphingomonas sp.]MBA4760954.1 response regulator transcription factor [Sphingomonas sp.]